MEARRDKLDGGRRARVVVREDEGELVRESCSSAPHTELVSDGHHLLRLDFTSSTKSPANHAWGVAWLVEEQHGRAGGAQEPSYGVPCVPVRVAVQLSMLSESGKAEIPSSVLIMRPISSFWSLLHAFAESPAAAGPDCTAAISPNSPKDHVYGALKFC